VSYGKNGEKIRRLGPDCNQLKYTHKKRVSKLQHKGKIGLCKKLSKKQLNRQRYINHKVSKQIVQIAREQSSAIVLEKLEPRKKGSKIKHYTEKAQWAFYQLATFIAYKAALSSVPVYYVDPYRTSKTCSRCGSVMEVNGKKFHCTCCGHLDHRDANAAHNIRQTFLDPNWIPKTGPVRLIDDPYKIRSYYEQ
jgi:putative transposase